MQPARHAPEIRRRAATPAVLLLLAALAACASDSPVRPSGDPDSDPLALLRDGGPSAAHSSPGVKLSREDQMQLTALRQITAKYHNIDKARDDGYELFTPCWEHTEDGAMGYHYARADYVWDDGVIDLMQPEILMYEPGPGGQMKLVGMEYIVFTEDWQGDNLPVLLGQTLHPHSSLPLNKLHIWLWRDNRNGLFNDWNPKVSCDHAAETQTFD